MLITIMVGTGAVVFAWLAKYRNTRTWLSISFVLIFVFLALRYDFGNDYRAYLEGFLQINSYSGMSLLDKPLNQEIGWILLCRLFSSVGFFVMIATLAAANSIIFYRFVKRNVPINVLWLSVFLYVFTSGLMLIHSSAMRQSIAINLFILALPYLQKKKIVPYFLCIAVATLFHSSAIVLAPVYLINLINKKIRLAYGIAILSLFVSLFIIGRFIYIQIDQIIRDRFSQYEAYINAGGTDITTGAGVLFLALILFLTIYYDRYQRGEKALLFKLNIINLLFVPLGMVLVMAGRVSMYFAPAEIIVIPIIVTHIKKRALRILFVSGVILFSIYTFIQFFNSPIWKDAFGTYRTIFTAPEN